MNVEISQHVDESDSADDDRPFRYAYTLYRFSAADGALVARSYAGSQEAHFLEIERRGRARMLEDVDLRRPLVARAADRLRAEAKHELNWLSGRGNG